MTYPVFWLFGLSGAGKSAVSAGLERRLSMSPISSYRLDGDVLRQGLNSDLGFSSSDRRENLRRSAHVAKLMQDAGKFVIASFITPMEADREMIQTILGGNCLMVYIDAPLSVCEQRDPKGLYAKARSGQIPQFTGISAPFEPPANPSLVVPTGQLTLEECVDFLYDQVIERIGNGIERSVS